MLDERQVIEKVSQHAGCSEDADARRAISATLSALSEFLTGGEATTLGHQLSSDWAAALLPATGPRPFERDAFYQAVARREGVAIGVALEHAHAVCGALADLLDGDTNILLRTWLGAEGTALFSAPTHGPAPARPVHTDTPRRNTLAEGRPGSRHPMSESPPPAAHEHSVAEKNPHEDSKISSARGTTQEGIGQTLAEGKPGPKRPISRA